MRSHLRGIALGVKANSWKQVRDSPHVWRLRSALAVIANALSSFRIRDVILSYWRLGWPLDPHKACSRKRDSLAFETVIATKQRNQVHSGPRAGLPIVCQ